MKYFSGIEENEFIKFDEHRGVELRPNKKFPRYWLTFMGLEAHLPLEEKSNHLQPTAATSQQDALVKKWKSGRNLTGVTKHSNQ